MFFVEYSASDEVLRKSSLLMSHLDIDANIKRTEDGCARPSILANWIIALKILFSKLIESKYQFEWYSQIIDMIDKMNMNTNKWTCAIVCCLIDNFFNCVFFYYTFFRHWQADQYKLDLKRNLMRTYNLVINFV